MRFIPVLGFIILIALLGALLLTKNEGQPIDAKNRIPLPALTLTSLDGKTKWDAHALQGQVTVLNFFASWCVPCEAEMPELSAFKTQFPDVHLEGVAWNDNATTLKKWLTKNGAPFRTVWLDKNGEATIALGIKGIPETIIVDAKGVMRYRLMGPLTAELRASTIDPLIHRLLDEEAHAH